MASLDLEMELNDEENQSPALLSARNSALSVFDEVFADEDEDDIKAVDDDAMPQLRYSIGTTGDRRHLHRLAQDIHGAHKQADCRGLDLHRALNARKAESTNKADELCRIPAWRPQMTRAKSCGLLLPSLLPFKRKSEPSEKLRAALASYDSPPKPRKTVSFANLAAALRSSRSSSPDNDEDEDEADPASPADIWDDDHAAQGHEWGEWVAQDGWGWEPPHVEPQLSGGMPFAMGQPMMVPMMNGNGDVFYVPQQMAVPQQMMPQQMMAGNVGYPAGFAMEAGFEYYAAVPMMPQQLPPHMAQHMMMPMMQPMPQQMMPQHMAPAAAAPPASPPQQHTPPSRGRAGAGERAPHHHAASPPLVSGQRSGRGALLAAAKEQQGSRRLQAELSRMSDAQLEAACAELAPHLLELATHTFGNYVVSKLAARPQAQPHLLAALRGRVVELLQHAQGSRVVQATLAALPAADAASLVGELDGHVLRCALDTHGSWGVCVAFKQTRAPFILAQMAKHMATLATQQHGIRVVQQVLNEAAACGMDLSAAVGALLEGELGFIAAHSFGNYSVQAALRHAAPAQREAMLAKLLPSLLALSRSKHGSNVAEMVLMRASMAQIEQVHAQIFGGPGRQLLELMESPYGNYVLQALLKRLDAAQRAAALQLIEAQTSSNNFGRAILAAAAA